MLTKACYSLLITVLFHCNVGADIDYRCNYAKLEFTATDSAVYIVELKKDKERLEELTVFVGDEQVVIPPQFYDYLRDPILRWVRLNFIAEAVVEDQGVSFPEGSICLWLSAAADTGDVASSQAVNQSLGFVFDSSLVLQKVFLVTEQAVTQPLLKKCKVIESYQHGECTGRAVSLCKEDEPADHTASADTGTEWTRSFKEFPVGRLTAARFSFELVNELPVVVDFENVVSGNRSLSIVSADVVSEVPAVAFSDTSQLDWRYKWPLVTKSALDGAKYCISFTSYQRSANTSELVFHFDEKNRLVARELPVRQRTKVDAYSEEYETIDWE